ncbi:rho GTPase-activating protein 29-like, partial [Sturnira hondurensis]|uniref:rho GTPase-activating protein 29-like n=1 Tax=Sturnira hondurensis TaxID=192404 RepID=UPI00187A21E2
VTLNPFQLQLEATSLANDLQSFHDRAKLHDPGQEYREFVKATNSTEEEKVDGSVTKPSTSNAHTSGFGPADSLEDVVGLPHSSDKIEEATCSTSADAPGSSFGRSWRMVIDSENTGGSSEFRFLGSESISPGIEILKSSRGNSMKD